MDILGNRRPIRQLFEGRWYSLRRLCGGADIYAIWSTVTHAQAGKSIGRTQYAITRTIIMTMTVVTMIIIRIMIITVMINTTRKKTSNPLRFEYNQTPLQAETQRKFTSARNATDLVHSSNATCGYVPSRGNKSNNSAWTGYTEITLLLRILLPFIRWFGCWVVTVIQNKGVVGGSSQRWVSVYFSPEKGCGYFHLVWRGLIKKDEQIDVRVWISFDYFEGIFKLETS